MSTLVVAALSARLLAQCAARDGYDVIALDAFGDVDTRRAARRWEPVGADGALQLDATRVVDALVRIAREQPGVLGWIAGPGFEAVPEALAAGAAVLPLIGSRPDAQRRVRDPQAFYGALRRLGIEHPDTVFGPVPDDGTWLLKDLRGCGDWHVRRARRGDPLPPQHVHQREVAGTPMSAAFVGNGGDAVLLGVHEMSVAPVAGRPHVFHGVIGPVAVDAALRAVLDSAVRALVREFALHGICSLDFMFTPQRAQVIELNPRPGASLALHACEGLGPVAAHVQACLHGRLPTPIAATARVRASRIVYARRAMRLGEAAARCIDGCEGAQDIAQPGVCVEAGDPICSIEIDARDAMIARRELEQRAAALLQQLEALA